VKVSFLNITSDGRAAQIELRNRQSNRGVSLIELLIVLAIISILTAITIPFVSSYTRTYKTEKQAIQVMDLMREAAQLAMNRRRSMRFEIDRTDPSVPAARVVDEMGADPDVTIKSIPLEPESIVRMDRLPDSVSVPAVPGFPAVEIEDSFSIRFRSNGAVVNSADLPLSATFVFWPPITEPVYSESNLTPRRREEIRGVTIDAAAGAMRMWKYTGSDWVDGQ
jgi:prepilin-type N-terminal cleavage/methylation domain-containing protein